MGISDTLDDLFAGLFISGLLLWLVYDAVSYSIQEFVEGVHVSGILPYCALLAVSYVAFRCYEIALRNHKRWNRVHDAATEFFKEINGF